MNIDDANGVVKLFFAPPTDRSLESMLWGRAYSGGRKPSGRL